MKRHPIPTGNRSLRAASRQRGVALVISLALLVLLTFVAVAFLSNTQRARQIESASAAGTSATELARSAASILLSDLQKEIVAGSTQNGTADNPIYRPTGNDKMVPENTAGTSGDSALLVKKSGDPFFTGGSNATITANVATSVATSTQSRNGRTVPAERWARPQLLPAGTNPPVPEWINLATSGLTPGTGNSTAPVIGRFAFTVYDTSGLIDINNMGSDLPDGTSRAAQFLPFKGHPFFADIDGILGGSSPNARTITDWRFDSARTGVFSNPAPWTEFFENWSETGGVSPSWVGASPKRFGRQFVGRQDLLNAADAAQAGIVDNLLPAVTHFSRELNAPSLPFVDATEIGAPNGFPTAAHFAAAYSATHTIQLYRDDGTSYTIDVKAGDPVLQRRFSLGKLGRETAPGTYTYWLTPTGPGPGITESAIRDVFGLAWDNPNERWIYVGAGTSGSSPATEIKSLADVADENRPPDFFEVLKAGINPNSLGGRQTENGASQLSTTERVRQGSEDLHILRIGANMIDQADNDNYPTRIAFVPGSGTGTIEVAGIEDLPYLFGSILQPQYQRWALTEDELEQALIADGVDPAQAASDKLTKTGWYWNNFRVMLTPMLFNPHRQSSAAINGTPPALRVQILPGGRLSGLIAGGRIGPLPFLVLGNYTSLIELQGGELPVRTTPGFYSSGPKSISNTRGIAIAGGNRNSLELFRLPTTDGVEGMPGGAPFLTGYWDRSSIIPPNDTRNRALFNGFSPQFENLNVALQYQTPRGDFRTYDALGGGGQSGWEINTNHAQFGYNTNYQAFGDGTGAVPTPPRPGTSSTPYSTPSNFINVAGMFFKPDPRTTRYGNFFTKGDRGNSAVAPYPQAHYRPGDFSGSYLSSREGEIPVNPSPNSDAVNMFIIYKNRGTASIQDFNHPGPPVNFPSINPVVLHIGTSGPTYGDVAFNLRLSELAAGGTSAGTGPYLENIADRPQDAPLVFRPNDAFFADLESGSNPLISESVSQANPGAPSDPSSSSRPVILQRPFRNVAELGHVFRDQPYKSINFFHQDSADLALFDLFQISEIEAPVVAGKVNPNTAINFAMRALLRGTGNILSASATDYTALVDNSDAEAIANNFPSRLNPRSSVGDAMAAALPAMQTQIETAFGKIKVQREGVARALSGSTQTRTWNLMIDVIAQAGQYPPGNPEAAHFIVQGESRFWVHAAIDRFTGEIVDIQWESINE